jgi:LmbE family N-acetylglucosaminyl deacetylase
MGEIKIGSNVLVVGAHPDDIEMGCGGSITKHLELGDEVFILIMTNGENGDHHYNREECLNSLRTLGLHEDKIIFGNFPDGNLKDNNLTVSFIEKYIDRLKINKVYTHSPEDRHQDHRNCSNAVSSAARKISEILLFQGPSTRVNFEPHYFVQLSEEQLGRKINALSCYQSQIRKGIVNLNHIKSVAGANGVNCNAGYAEAFAINHIFREGRDV